MLDLKTGWGIVQVDWTYSCIKNMASTNIPLPHESEDLSGFWGVSSFNEAAGEEVDCFIGVVTAVTLGSLGVNNLGDGQEYFGWNAGRPTQTTAPRALR